MEIKQKLEEKLKKESVITFKDRMYNVADYGAGAVANAIPGAFWAGVFGVFYYISGQGEAEFSKRYEPMRQAEIRLEQTYNYLNYASVHDLKTDAPTNALNHSLDSMTNFATHSYYSTLVDIAKTEVEKNPTSSRSRYLVDSIKSEIESNDLSDSLKFFKLLNFVSFVGMVFSAYVGLMGGLCHNRKKTYSDKLDLDDKLKDNETLQYVMNNHPHKAQIEKYVSNSFETKPAREVLESAFFLANQSGKNVSEKFGELDKNPQLYPGIERLKVLFKY